MTAEQIIKALECCLDYSCLICPCEKGASILCIDDLHQYALNLINRQQAEIERLKPLEENLDKLLYMLNAADVGQSVLEEQKHTIKAEAVKEFAARLTDKAELVRVNAFDSKWAISDETIDNLVKEMVGETNAE